jgi:RHS repeat-associated protein
MGLTGVQRHAGELAMPVTKYIWDDENLLAEADGTNMINVVYTNEPQQYGDLISSRISGTTSYHHFDALGSTRQLTNAAGTVTDTAIYDAWGNVVNRTGTTGISLLWLGDAGYYLDSETALHYIRARTYAPTLARWLSFDPILFAGSINLFLYSANGPSQYADPSGQDCADCEIKQPSGCEALKSYNSNPWSSPKLILDVPLGTWVSVGVEAGIGVDSATCNPFSCSDGRMTYSFISCAGAAKFSGKVQISVGPQLNAAIGNKKLKVGCYVAAGAIVEGKGTVQWQNVSKSTSLPAAQNLCAIGTVTVTFRLLLELRVDIDLGKFGLGWAHWAEVSANLEIAQVRYCWRNPPPCLCIDRGTAKAPTVTTRACSAKRLGAEWDVRCVDI